MSEENQSSSDVIITTNANDTVNCELTEEQKQRILGNRKRALELKRKRILENTEKIKDDTVKQTKTPPVSNKLIDTGGGFLLDEHELFEEKKKKICSIEKAPYILPPNQPTCLECQKNFAGSYLLEKFDHAVCDDCRDPKEKHALITKTEAKKNYILTDVDLEQRGTPLKYILGKNPHNSRWSDMKLYLLLQVEKRALEIWGSEEKLLEELDRRDEKRAVTKHKAYRKKMKSLRMSIRSSLYTRSLTETHTHEFGEETYNSDDDTYSHYCVTCDFKETYEKM
ncbi:hypothetical protein PGB90_009585 [Kerria lacca]